MFLALISAVLGGELVVMSDTRVSVEVDGRPVSAPGGERGSLAAGLAGGVHRVQVFDAQDRLLASSTAEVAPEEQVRLELRKGRLVELGRGRLAGVCPVAEAAEAPGAVKVVVGAGSGAVPAGEGPLVLFMGAERAGTVAGVAPVAPVASVAPMAISTSELSSIVAAISAASFSADKLGVLRSAVTQRWFTIAQVGTLLDQYAHSSDKVEAAGLLAPRTVDPLNAYLLDEHLTFSSDKAAVRRLYAR